MYLVGGLCFWTFSRYLIPTVLFSGSNQVGPWVAEVQSIHNQQEQKVTSNKTFSRETTKTETAQLRASESESDSHAGLLKMVSNMPPPRSKRKDIGYTESENASKRQKDETVDGVEGGQAGTIVSKMARHQSTGDAGKYLLIFIIIRVCLVL